MSVMVQEQLPIDIAECSFFTPSWKVKSNERKGRENYLQSGYL
jgi:hypothetical protein